VKFQRPIAFLLIVLASTAFALLAEAWGGVTGVTDLEDRTLDWRQRMTPESFQGLSEGDRESDVVIVFFDRFSIEAWPWEQPFPRAHIAEVIDALSASGARTIGLDVFLDLEHPALNEIDFGDDLLEAAIERAGNVILVAPVERTDSGPVVDEPHPRFARSAADIGLAELPASFETFRNGNFAVRSGARLEPSLALAMYGHATGLNVDSLLLSARSQGRIALPGLPPNVGLVPEDWWTTSASATKSIVPFTIRYVGPPSSSDAEDPPGTFKAFSSSSVVDVAMLFPEMFEDKIILIGTGFHEYDKFRTPFYAAETPADAEGMGGGEEYGWMFGVEIHANALQNLLDQEYVRPLGFGQRLVLLLLMAILGGIVAFWKGAGWGGATTVAATLGVFAAGFWMWVGEVFVPGATLFHFDRPFLWLPIVTPAISAILGYVGSVAYVSVVEGREKRFIKSAFGKYVSPAVVAEIAGRPEALQLGGQKRPLSLLFSDLAGFTTLSERMDPQDLLAHLNEYLSDMTTIVMDEGGTLDKYIGDAIMAFWNAPQDIADHGDRALRTMILMQRKMDDLNDRWRERDEGHEDLVVRIGVNSGEVVVGNVGGAERFDYSAVGDAVNLAARLEPANKTYDTLNMTSESTLAISRREEYRVRELDLVAVKGKEQPVEVYEVLEFAGFEFSAEKEKMLELYEAGMSAYKRHEWEAAATHFEAGLAAFPSDGPSRLYLDRSRANAADPPPPDWDFVVRRTVK
jgi:adenylate cyclase